MRAERLGQSNLIATMNKRPALGFKGKIAFGQSKAKKPRAFGDAPTAKRPPPAALMGFGAGGSFVGVHSVDRCLFFLPPLRVYPRETAVSCCVVAVCVDSLRACCVIRCPVCVSGAESRQTNSGVDAG